MSIPSSNGHHSSFLPRILYTGQTSHAAQGYQYKKFVTAGGAAGSLFSKTGDRRLSSPFHLLVAAACEFLYFGYFKHPGFFIWWLGNNLWEKKSQQPCLFIRLWKAKLGHSVLIYIAYLFIFCAHFHLFIHSLIHSFILISTDMDPNPTSVTTAINPPMSEWEVSPCQGTIHTHSRIHSHLGAILYSQCNVLGRWEESGKPWECEKLHTDRVTWVHKYRMFSLVYN